MRIRGFLGWLVGIVVFAGASSVWSQRPPTSTVMLDGRLLRVRWLDGDTFHSAGRPRIKARLEGYNTLENYGPVHRWGTWTARELDRINDQASALARSRTWRCETLPEGGGYGRALVRCEDFARALLLRGLAHTYSIRGPADARWNAWQHQAQRKKKGIWAKGIPAYLVTSVHSRNARYRNAYIRLISTRDGSSKKIEHNQRFRTCEWVCREGSCMRYVPYKQRFGSRRASCLR